MAKFCPKCGLPLKEDATVMGMPSFSADGIPRPVLIGGAAAVLVVALGIGWMTAARGNPGPKTVRVALPTPQRAPGQGFRQPVVTAAAQWAPPAASAPRVASFTPQAPTLPAFPRRAYEPDVPAPPHVIAMNPFFKEPQRVAVSAPFATRPQIPVLPPTPPVPPPFILPPQQLAFGPNAVGATQPQAMAAAPGGASLTDPGFMGGFPPPDSAAGQPDQSRAPDDPWDARNQIARGGFNPPDGYGQTYNSGGVNPGALGYGGNRGFSPLGSFGGYGGYGFYNPYSGFGGTFGRGGYNPFGQGYRYGTFR